uniref:Uncharacterized protein n=1 Tax=Anguilla anguilla TaxID=7936 RepID=A0A0E9V752_ANGAN
MHTFMFCCSVNIHVTLWTKNASYYTYITCVTCMCVMF